MQLVQSLLKAWDNDAYAKKLQGRKVVLICEGDAVCYTSDDGIKTKTIFLGVLKSTQEETDTRIILYCFYAQGKGYKIVHDRTPDRDIFFILLQYIDRLAGLTVRYWESQKTDQYDRDRSIHTEYRTALPALHAFCGCDTTSAL